MLCHPLAPRPEEVFIEDIAFALARRFRFNAATDYTVAQHCVAVSSRFPADGMLALWGLLHDTPEIYTGLGDVPRPVKPHVFLAETLTAHPPVYRSLESVEDRIMDVVAEALNLAPGGIPAEVSQADDRECAREAKAFFGGNPKRPSVAAVPFPEPINLIWVPEQAEAAFLARWADLATWRVPVTDGKNHR
jgi:hypothetical protein